MLLLGANEGIPYYVKEGSLFSFGGFGTVRLHVDMITLYKVVTAVTQPKTHLNTS